MAMESNNTRKCIQDTFCAVWVNGELSEWFETVMEVLQGCVLSPLLFNIFLEMIMAMALDESNKGVDIGGERIGDLRFADDIALLAEQEKGLQKTLTEVAQVSQKMGMKISIQKTECQTENFVYPGGNISTQEGSDNVAGQNVPDKMSRTKCPRTKSPQIKCPRTKCPRTKCPRTKGP